MAKVPSNMAADPIEADEKPICGLVMPISPLANYDTRHWEEVQTILRRAIKNAGFVPRPVWENGKTDFIHDRVVTNLFENPLIIADVSGRNPNVMLELGMRLSFGKPVIVVADDPSNIPFDTTFIEHIFYPADLHILQIERFMEELTTKMTEIEQRSRGGDYKPFIKYFGGTIEPGSLNQDAQPFQDYVVDQLRRLTETVAELDRGPILIPGGAPQWAHNFGVSKTEKNASPSWRSRKLTITLPGKINPKLLSAATDIMQKAQDVRGVTPYLGEGNQFLVEFDRPVEFSDVIVLNSQFLQNGIQANVSVEP